MHILWVVFGIGSAALLVAYIRLLTLADRIAAKADEQGLTINSVWGRKQLAWSDVKSIELQVTAARGHRVVFIKVLPYDRRQFLVPTSAVYGGSKEVEGWISRVQQYL
jgi:hypothetical protein